MASVGVFKEVPKYTSGRLSPISTSEVGERELEFRSTLQGLRTDELPWMKLFHNDELYKVFVNELFCLNCDDEGETPPASHVIEQILELTPFAKSLLAHEWSTPWITTDDSGGIRLSWRQGARELRAVVPAESRRERYLYWQEGSSHGTIPTFGSATLFTRLHWLNGQDNR